MDTHYRNPTYACWSSTQSLVVFLFCCEAIFDFFLLSFNFSPALTIASVSVLQSGQYLQHTPLFIYSYLYKESTE
jgi:hypothetical protein